MKALTIFIVFAFVLLCGACDNNTGRDKDLISAEIPDKTEVPERDGVFIHITQSYNDPHRVLMPLKMAILMADEKDVLVYMDIHAVEFLIKESKDIQFADFESAHTYIRMLKEKNVGVYACPTCLKIAGFNPDDLMEGIQIADKDKFFNFTSGRIVNLDY